MRGWKSSFPFPSRPSWTSLIWPLCMSLPLPSSSPQASSVSPCVQDTIRRLRLQPKESPRMRGSAGRKTARKEASRMVERRLCKPVDGCQVSIGLLREAVQVTAKSSLQMITVEAFDRDSVKGFKFLTLCVLVSDHSMTSQCWCLHNQFNGGWSCQVKRRNKRRSNNNKSDLPLSSQMTNIRAYGFNLTPKHAKPRYCHFLHINESTFNYSDILVHALCVRCMYKHITWEIHFHY